MSAYLPERVRTDRGGHSDRPGVYAAGDLGAAPTLKAAMRDGAEVARAVHAALGPPGGDGTDVVIVGAGPAGIAAAATLRDLGRRVVVIDREAPMQTVARFPKGKTIYAEPRELEVHPLLTFETADAHALVATWRERIAAGGLDVRTPVALGSIDGSDGAFVVNTDGDPLPARKVIVAIGRRGTPRALDVPGGDLPHVFDVLDDAERYAGSNVLVVGGGDSAVEAAVALSRVGTATLVHRDARFPRLKKKNREALAEARARGLRVVAPGRVVSVTPGYATIDVDGRSELVPADHVFALIGADLPKDLLARLGLRLDGDRAAELARLPAIGVFATFVWCFYVLKQHRELVPFAGTFAWIHDALRVPVPWYPTADGAVRVLDAGFFGTALYTATIAIAALFALRRHPTAEQRRRYASLVAFQAIALFGVPELLAPMITSAPAKLYTIGVPWPLSTWSLAHEPAAWGWLLVGALVSFVGIPLYVWRQGERFCSWMCGCGGLAETLGDVFRWRAPRGDSARLAEWAGVGILVCAIPVTLLVLNDLWGFVGFRTWLDDQVSVGVVEPRPVAPAEGDLHVARAEVQGAELHLYVEKFDWDGAWHDTGWIRAVEIGDQVVYPTKISDGHYAVAVPDGPIRVLATGSSLSRASDFARNWYGLVVDFALASIVGVAFYPLLGNRVWCRFFCPLRAYMELISKRIGRLAIVADDRCISCGECTKHCQMGIDVQGFAEQQAVLDNRNSSCIQCGICTEVCPMGTLSLVDKPAAGVPDGELHPVGPRWGV